MTVAKRDMQQAAAHDNVRADMLGSDDSDEGEKVPEMLKLSGHSDDENEQHIKRTEDSDEDDDTTQKILQGEAKVIFSNKGGTVVRDYRQVEKAGAAQ